MDVKVWADEIKNKNGTRRNICHAPETFRRANTKKFLAFQLIPPKISQQEIYLLSSLTF